MQKQLFIIDDDAKLNRQLSEYLAQFSFRIQTFVRPSDALDAMRNENVDCVILDVMMPQMDGFTVCKEIRKTSTVPIIMLTARGDVTDRIVGLELGADDYVPKPFEPRELVARIQAVIRRNNPVHENDLQAVGDLTINYVKQTVVSAAGPVNLTSAEFELLAFFVKRPGRVVDRDTIVDNLKGTEWQAFDRSVDVTISRLRQKIGDNSKNPKYFKTVWGKGYIFIGYETEQAS